MSIIHLTPPQLSAIHIKEKIICIRAHRERIFKVSATVEQGKIICHNFGQGGAGWTFLFGCVSESIRQYEEILSHNPSFKNKPICVIGAGCYGLLTAIELARKGYTVRIVAKEIEHISSYKAAGFFFPRPRKKSTPEECVLFESYGMASYQTYLQIMSGMHPFIKAQPKLMPAYYSPTIDPGFAPYIAHNLIAPPQHVTINFGTDKTYKALQYTTIFINPAAIMEDLNHAIITLGISISRAEIKAFDEVPESIIFNCSSLGTRNLITDSRIIPVQGHLITLKNQPDMALLQYMINFNIPMMNPKGYIKDELIYFAPKESGILGITFLRGQDSLTANQHEFDRLLDRCHTFFGT
jgi:Glycine/D-amino acid oxidases (deaminating)